MMKRIGFLSCLGTRAALSGPGQTQAPKDGITLQSVKYSGLNEVIQKNRGKVILVDFWGDFCLPCKQGFPSRGGIAQEARQGGPGSCVRKPRSYRQSGRPENALRFLKKMGRDFTNLYLNEPPELWQKSSALRDRLAISSLAVKANGRSSNRREMTSWMTRRWNSSSWNAGRKTMKSDDPEKQLAAALGRVPAAFT